MNNGFITTSQIFDAIVKQLKAKGKYPDILDYGICRSTDSIKSPEFRIINNLDFGGNEGIYLHVMIEMCSEGRKKYSLGTFKTLDESDAGMRTMGILLADFVCETRRFVRENYDALDRTGYAVRGVKAGGTEGSYSLLASTLERAKSRIPEVTGNKDFVEAVVYSKEEQKVVYKETLV